MKKILLIVVICFLLLTPVSISFSKYKSSSSLNGNIELARPVLVLEVTSGKVNLTIPTDNVTILFNVKNYNDLYRNDVLLNYYLEFSSDEVLPVSYKLYDITSGSEKEISVSSNKSESIDMGFSENITHYYKLVFSWTDNSVKYSDITDNFKVRAVALQK